MLDKDIITVNRFHVSPQGHFLWNAGLNKKHTNFQH
jgi:hypothetical protein